MAERESPRIGAMFGHYRLDRLIGRGGMGEVYEAYDTVKDRTVALKVLTERLARDPVYRQRFQREAHAAARLKEAHVIPIHDYGEIGGHLYLDMRVVDGTSLRDVIARTGPLPPVRAVAIVTQIGAALDAAHQDHLVHRDVKPDNILVTPKGDFAYLVDFGIANALTDERLTAVGGTIGSFGYMAPERFEDAPITPAVDIYALTCVLYECLTGAPPFRGNADAQLIRAHMYEPAPKPTVTRPGTPAAFDTVVARGLAKNPADRYPTADALTTAAREALATSDSPVTVATPALRKSGSAPFGASSQSQWPPQVGSRPAHRRRRLLFGVVALVVVLAMAAAIGIWKSVSGTGDESPSGVDALDVGRYSAQPRALTGKPSEEEGRYLEAFRLAEALVNPYEVDPKLDFLYGAAFPDPQAAAEEIAGTSTPIVQPALEEYGMISAYRVAGLSKRFTEVDRAPEVPVDAVIDMVMSFPNPDAAARAAAEIDALDFASNSANIRETIPGYPEALAHYREESPSIGVTMAKDELVVALIVRNTTGNLNGLLDRVRGVLDLQVPLMDNYRSLTSSALTSLPRDPDDMLRRAFSTEEQPTVSVTFESIGPRAVVVCASPRSLKDGLFEETGIDRCATTSEGQVLRARDDAAASALLPKMVEASAYVDDDIPGPQGVPDALCYEQKQEVWTDYANLRFVCGIFFGRYVGVVWSNDEQDVRRRAAAQYAILVNSE